MFLNQLSKNEQKLYFNIAIVLTAIDNPIDEKDGVLPEFLRKVYNADPVRFAEQLKPDYKWKAKILKRIESEIDLLKKSIFDGYEHANSYETQKTINSVFQDYEKLIFTVDPDADEDEPVLSDAEQRLFFANKLLRRYIREAELKDMLPSARKVMIFELCALSLADGEITELEQNCIKKVSKLLDVEEFIFFDLQESAKSINRALSEALAIISE